jgi:hypothetical protein
MSWHRSNHDRNECKAKNNANQFIAFGSFFFTVFGSLEFVNDEVTAGQIDECSCR